MRIPYFCLLLSLASLSLLFSACSSAQPTGRLTGDQIRSTLIGNTIAGQIMGGEYSEYYQADGVIRGRDYLGAWTIEGDTLCVEYEGLEKSCYALELDGTSVKWLTPDGTLVGDGTLTPGNPNNY